MSEVQVGSVQSHPVNGIRGTAVAFVANDRVSALGQMHSDLMLPAGFQPHFQ
jgi:hypothetical protein